MNHGEDIGERDVDILAVLRVGTEAQSRGANERAEVVGRLNTFAGVPLDVVTIRQDGRSQGRAVVAAPADEHKSAASQRPSDRGDGRRTQSWAPCAQW